MKPLPVQRGIESVAPVVAPAALPGLLASPPSSYSTANRRASSNPAQRAYPWLLSISTLVAAAFCLLYITKPVIMVPTGGLQASPEKTALSMTGGTTTGTKVDLLPNRDLLPGEKKSALAEPAAGSSNPRKSLPPPPFSSNFEETNIRIQHVLTAEAPGGHLDRLDIDVPVLYQSRNMRWTSAEAAEARHLLTRLMDYQEKSLQLRAEGGELLESWNRLVGKSIPASELRADSPTLPANQQDAADAARPAGLITTESIQIKPPVK